MSNYKTKVVGFLCNWCSYEGADRAGAAKLKYPGNLRTIRVMCSGRVEPQFILKAFREGASGVLILGCHPGDCHYKSGNYKAVRRIELLRNMLAQLGIEPERIRLDWVAASEGEKFARVANEMVETIEKLGPLQIKFE
ncbi:hydrogenase iron-sulfur subunit [bacterium]|nr:hydrogenase iron-sulfur subunit [bacterium]